MASLPQYEVVGEADSARDGLRVIDAARPHIVLMDVALPGMDGVVATREILRRLPSTRVVILSAHAQIHDVIDAMTAGAVGYVLKSDPIETLTEALDRAVSGLGYVAPKLAPLLLAFATSRPGDGALGILSEREHEVFRLAADCSTSSEIARELCVARKTVDVHLNRINRKLGLRNRAELVRLAAGLGLVIRFVPRLRPPAIGSSRAFLGAIALRRATDTLDGRKGDMIRGKVLPRKPVGSIIRSRFADLSASSVFVIEAGGIQSP